MRHVVVHQQQRARRRQHLEVLPEQRAPRQVLLVVPRQPDPQRVYRRLLDLAAEAVLDRRGLLAEQGLDVVDHGVRHAAQLVRQGSVGLRLEDALARLVQHVAGLGLNCAGPDLVVLDGVVDEVDRAVGVVERGVDGAGHDRARAHVVRGAARKVERDQPARRVEAHARGVHLVLVESLIAGVEVVDVVRQAGRVLHHPVRVMDPALAEQRGQCAADRRRAHELRELGLRRRPAARLISRRRLDGAVWVNRIVCGRSETLSESALRECRAVQTVCGGRECCMTRA